MIDGDNQPRAHICRHQRRINGNRQRFFSNPALAQFRHRLRRFFLFCRQSFGGVERVQGFGVVGMGTQ